MTQKESNNEGEHLDIFFSDLTPKAQAEVLAHCKVKCPTQLNADMFPLCTMPQPEEPNRRLTIQVELNVPLNTYLLDIIMQDDKGNVIDNLHVTNWKTI